MTRSAASETQTLRHFLRGFWYRWEQMSIVRKVTGLSLLLSLTVVSVASVALTLRATEAIRQQSAMVVRGDMRVVASLIDEQLGLLSRGTQVMARPDIIGSIFLESDDLDTTDKQKRQELLNRLVAIFDQQMMPVEGLREVKFISMENGGREMFRATWSEAEFKLIPKVATQLVTADVEFAMRALRPGAENVLFEPVQVAPLAVAEEENARPIARRDIRSALATIRIISPVRDSNNRLRGALIVTIDLSGFLRRMSDVVGADNALLFMSTKQQSNSAAVAIEPGSVKITTRLSSEQLLEKYPPNTHLHEQLEVGAAGGKPVVSVRLMHDMAVLESEILRFLALAALVLCMSFMFSLMFTRVTVRPLHRLFAAAQEITQGKRSSVDLSTLGIPSDFADLMIEIAKLRQDFEHTDSASRDLARRLAFATQIATEVGKFGIWEWRAGDGADPLGQETWNSVLAPVLENVSDGDTQGYLIQAIHPDDRGAFVDLWRKSDPGKKVQEARIRLRMPDGAYREHTISARVVREQEHGTASVVICALVDIEEFRRVEKMKSEFVSTVSHEMRTPLTSVLGALRIITAAGIIGDNPRLEQLIAMATKNGQSLLQLINDLLDISRIEAGLFEIFPAECDLVEIVSESIANIRTYLPEKKLDFRLEGDDGPQMLRCDKARIAQVMRNLLSNAAKFSPVRGIVTVRVSAATKIGQGLRVTVLDQGPGIPMMDRERIFERFSQVDSSDRRSYGGTGLGLAISRQIVEAHSGAIWVGTMTPGAEFILELPAGAATGVSSICDEGPVAGA